MPAKNILIFTAVRAETRAVQKFLRGSACRVHAVGIAARHLPSAGEMEGAAAIIMCGVAGGLDPSLAIGDVVLDDRHRLLPTELPYRRGIIHSAANLISTPLQKAELFRTTGAVAVDMEQAAVAAFASPLNVPVIGLRAISDTSSHAIDPKVLKFVDDLGNPKPASIALGVLRHPALVPQLMELNANMNVALHSLATAIRAIVAALEVR